MNRENFQFRFAGSGGMGVILGTIILAEAALKEDHFVVQSQSYGPEARGGECKAEMIMSTSEIDFPKIERADCLAALTQKSFDRYVSQLKPDGVIIADSSVVIPEDCTHKYVQVPIIETAYDVLRKPITINIVALGAINGILNLVSDEALTDAVLSHVPAGTEDLNCRALDEGKKIAEGLSL